MQNSPRHPRAISVGHQVLVEKRSKPAAQRRGVLAAAAARPRLSPGNAAASRVLLRCLDPGGRGFKMHRQAAALEGLLVPGFLAPSPSHPSELLAASGPLEREPLRQLGFSRPRARAAEEPACDAVDPGSIPGWERCPGEGIGYPLQYPWASLVAQLVKNLPAKRETWLRFLGREDALEEGTATHSSIPAWRMPWTEELAGYSPRGRT